MSEATNDLCRSTVGAMCFGLKQSLLLVGLVLAVMLDALNATIFGMARGHVMGTFHLTPDEAAWIGIVYLSAKLTLFPCSSWFIKKYSLVTVIWVALSLCAVTSLICAISVNYTVLIGSRAMQGAAGAVLIVSAQTLLLGVFPSNRQGLVQAIFALAVVVAPTSLAPVVQGYFIDAAIWQASFVLSIALAAGAASILLCMPESVFPKYQHAVNPFDWLGFVLFAIAMLNLTYILNEGTRWNWFEARHLRWSAAVFVVAIAICIHRLVTKSDQVLLDRGVFGDDHFTFGFFVSFIAGAALFGSAFLIQAFTLSVLRFPAGEAGLLLLPSGLATITGLCLAGWLITYRNTPPIAFIPLGVLLFMTSMWLMSRTGLQSGWQDLSGALLLRGFGLGFLFLSLTLITLSGLKPIYRADGVGLFNWGRQLGGLIGVAVLSSYNTSMNATNLQVLGRNFDPSNTWFGLRRQMLGEVLIERGLAPGLAEPASALMLQSMLKPQVAMLSFNEAFLALALLFVLAVPIILSFKMIQKRFGA
ncbi:MFS transporter [Tritonibacter mobilis]|uniref:MFS transporter n=1 Tax=Tritonibacter mobilis TaxID=379347 RepID=UPI0001B8AF30|nr:drug resistance transporter, EmrB/QacA subfamily [Ruegeria sp. TrichCH4B]